MRLPDPRYAGQLRKEPRHRKVERAVAAIVGVGLTAHLRWRSALPRKLLLRFDPTAEHDLQVPA